MNTSQDVDQAVALVVDMLRVRNRLTKADLAEKSGIPLRTLSRRLNGAGHWEWREVAQLAAYFNVPISLFYEGPSDLLGGASGKVSTYVASALGELVPA